MNTRTKRAQVVVGILMGTLLAAMDAMIMSTTMPAIIKQLSGMALYSWPLAIYLLTATTTVPVYGKLADLIGRKPMYLAGTALFIAGSVLCGMATSMGQLILFRAVQGLGAGAVLPVGSIIIADIFPLEKRAKMQAMFSGIWGIASVIGPGLGAFIVSHWSWHWLFYINIPFGLIAMALVAGGLHEDAKHRGHDLDLGGTVSLTLGITALMMLLPMDQNSAHPITGMPSPTVLWCIAAASIAWFVLSERRAKEPMIPYSLFKNPVISVSNIGGFLSGFVMFSLLTFVPLFVKAVLGMSNASVGIIVTAMALAWPLGSTIGGRLILRLGYRTTSILGCLVLAAGAALLLGLTPQAALWQVSVAIALVGLGLGFCTLTYILAVQNAVGYEKRGIVTGLLQFFRTIGGSIGAAVMGAVVAITMRNATGLGLAEAHDLLDEAKRAAMDPARLHALTAGLAGAIHLAFQLAVGVTLLGLASSAFFPAGSARDLAHGGAPVGEAVEEAFAEAVPETMAPETIAPGPSPPNGA